MYSHALPPVVVCPYWSKNRLPINKRQIHAKSLQNVLLLGTIKKWEASLEKVKQA